MVVREIMELGVILMVEVVEVEVLVEVLQMEKKVRIENKTTVF